MLDSIRYYTEQLGAKDKFWDNAQCRQLYMNNMNHLFNRCAAEITDLCMQRLRSSASAERRAWLRATATCAAGCGCPTV